jgi:phosphotransferase system  glucose/maltose/N-acetylglucosamine-specific IIC component
VLHGKTNWVTFAIGAATLAVILLLKDKKRVPGILIAVAGATVAVGVLDLASHNVAILGSLPQGLPAFAIPWITTDDIVPVIIGGCAVALVSFADTSVLSRVYAARTIPTSTRTRRWWGSVSPIWRAGCFKASRSAAVHRAPPWPKQRGQNPTGRRRRCAGGRRVADGGAGPAA